jgi:hypothetical protein
LVSFQVGVPSPTSDNLGWGASGHCWNDRCRPIADIPDILLLLEFSGFQRDARRFFLGFFWKAFTKSAEGEGADLAISHRRLFLLLVATFAA